MQAVPDAHATRRSTRTKVGRLSPLERWLLGVTLALLDEPAVLLVDDVDGLRGRADVDAAWAVLRSLAGSATRHTPSLTVVASCRDVREATSRLAGAPVVLVGLGATTDGAGVERTELLSVHHDEDPLADLNESVR